MSSGYTNGKPDVSWWMQQIHGGIKYRKKETEQQSWDTWRKYYAGDWDSGVLPVNLFFKMARTIVPRVYFRNPSVSISPAQPGMLNWAFAQLLERIDNKMITEMRTKQTFKSVVTNTWFFGTGAVKVGFGSEYSLGLEQFGGEQPFLRKGSMTHQLETNARAGQSMPWVDSVHTGNLIVPDGLQHFHTTPWVADWSRRPRFDVENDPRFKNVKDLAKASSSVRAGMNEHEFRKQENMDMIDLIEIHDMRTGKVIVIAPYVTDRVLYFGDDELNFFGISNYKPVVFNPRDNGFWGVPDSKILEPDQREINEVRTLMMYHWRLSVVKILYKHGAIDDGDVTKILNGDVMAAIKVLNGNPQAAVEVMKSGEIPTSLFQADAQINQDVREMQGFSRNEFGDHTPSSSRTTATESRIVKIASEIRVDERRDTMADALADTIEHVNRIIFNHWDNEQVIQLAGPLGVPLWVKFKPSMLKRGHYTIKVDPDSSLPETRDSREQRAVQVYGILKENPLIDPARLTLYLLHELHGVQYDDMMRGMPPGLGGPTQPLDVQQYAQLATAIAQSGAGLSPVSQVADPTSAGVSP